jgi:triosephosphate isomerase
MRQKIVAGNWKMFLDAAACKALTTGLKEDVLGLPHHTVQVILAPAYIHIPTVCQLLGDTPGFSVAAQNMHEAEQGAFTGEVSAAMLTSYGVTHVIIGHSERRQIFGESHERLAAKVSKALAHALTPIFCIGETLEEREAGNTFQVIESQLSKGLFHLTSAEMARCIIAYEPVWAIGTGKTASPDQAQEVHAFIRTLIQKQYAHIADTISILYGGSVNPGNAADIFSRPDIDGGLVGGSSLKVEDFMQIIKAR